MVITKKVIKTEKNKEEQKYHEFDYMKRSNFIIYLT
jgi:hypothetical protein